MLIPRKPKYELVAPSDTDDGHWRVRITKGKFKNTVYAYGTITPEEKSLKYNFEIHETEFKNLTNENRDFRKVVEAILIDILQKELYGNANSTTPDS